MSVTMVRAKVRAELVPDVEATATAMFAAIDEARPDTVRYTAMRLPDGETYVVLLALDLPDVNPLDDVPEWVDFQERLRNWLAEPPVIEAVEVIGSHRFF